MIPPPLPSNEESRLAALERYRLDGIGRERAFDHATDLAAQLFKVPISLVSIVGADEQCFKGAHGLDGLSTPRAVSFCGHAILRREVMVVPDALRDPRFADNPMVTGEPRIRFYAGYPLVLPCGSCVGTLCIVDTRPHQLDEAAIRLLRDFGSLVQQELTAGGPRDKGRRPG